MKRRLALSAVLLSFLVSSLFAQTNNSSNNKSQTVQPHQSQTVQPYHAQEVQPYHAKPIEPYQAKPSDPYKSHTVDPYRADPIKPGDSRRSTDVRNSQSAGPVSDFFGAFSLRIPGVAYTTDNYATNTRTTTVAPGAQTTDILRVNPDQTYEWTNSWEHKRIRGRWTEKNGNVVLLRAEGGHDWLMQRTNHHSKAAVTVWDQNWMSYEGVPVRVR